MNWITTNIRLPEDVYTEIKLEAFKDKKSFGAVVRERLTKKKHSVSISTKKLLDRLEKLARENDRQNPGISFSEKLIEMRYEQ